MKYALNSQIPMKNEIGLDYLSIDDYHPVFGHIVII